MKNKANVLYIDDDERNLKAFRRMFKNDYNITIANSAEEGSKLLVEGQFNVIISDQRMPQMTGTEFFATYCSELKHIPKILLTAYTDISAVIDAVNKGEIYRYVSKPYQKEQLQNYLDDAYKLNQYRIKQIEEHKKYQEVFLNANDAIFLMNETGRIIDVNNSLLKLIGASRERLLYKSYLDLFEKGNIKKEIIEKFETYKIIENHEMSIDVKGKGKVDYLISLKRALTSDDEITYQGTIKDISAVKSSMRYSIRQIIADQEAAKQKLFDEIHEGTAQKLAGIKFMASAIASSSSKEPSVHIDALKQIDSTLGSVIDELRKICFKLIPSSLLKSGLGDSLRELAPKIEKQYDIHCEIIVDNFYPRLTIEIETILFRVIEKIIHLLKDENISIDLYTENSRTYAKVTGTDKINPKEVIASINAETDSYNITTSVEYEKPNTSSFLLSTVNNLVELPPEIRQ